MKEKSCIVQYSIAQLFEIITKDLGIDNCPLFPVDLKLFIYLGSENPLLSIHFEHSGGFSLSFHNIFSISIADSQNHSSVYTDFDMPPFDKVSDISIVDGNYHFDFIDEYNAADEKKYLVYATNLEPTNVLSVKE